MRLLRPTAAKALRSAPRSPALASLVCAAVAVALLPACSWMPFRHKDTGSQVHECNKPQLYAEAHSVAPLAVPTGLDPPSTRSVLKIPDLTAPEAPRALSDPCLDEPPKCANVRLLPVPGSGARQKKHWYSRDKKQPAPVAAPATAPSGAAPAVPAAPAPAAAPPATTP